MSKPSGYRQVICYDSGINTFALGCLAIPSIFVGFIQRYDCWYRYSVFGTAIF
jgi:hypothetical protein